MKKHLYVLISLLLLSGAGAAAPGAAVEKGKWIALTGQSFPGGGFGDTVPGGQSVVDRTTGAVYMNAGGRGMWKSVDGGNTFARLGDGKVLLDGFPARASISYDGQKIAMFNCAHHVKPPPEKVSGVSVDGGKTWETVTSIDPGLNSAGVIEPGKGQTMLALGDEGRNLYRSTDLGKTWVELSKSKSGVIGFGVFSATEMVIAYRYKIERSEDAGKTWTRVSDIGGCCGPLVITQDAAYWSCQRGLVVSRDKGKTWAIQGVPPADPMFWNFPLCAGKDENSFAVATRAGMAETKDGGKSWKVITPPIPQTEQGRDWGYAAYDPVNDIFYFSATDHSGHNQMKCVVDRAASYPPAKPPAGEPELSGASADEAFEQLKKRAGTCPVLRVKTVAKAPEMDGKIDDVFEKSSPPLKFRFLNGKDGDPKDATTTWVVADKENLYIAARCETAEPDKVITRITEHDDEVYNDECLDMYIDPLNQRKDCYCFHLAVNSAGVTWEDDDHDDMSWDPAIAVKCGQEPGKAWTMELKIPLADLRLKPGAPFRAISFNIGRTVLDHADPGKVLEDTAWSPTGSDKSNVPERFGYLFIESPAGDRP